MPPGKSRIYSADQFQLSEQLGKGSFGVVYKGLDLLSNTPVAVKQIDLESCDEDIDEIQKEITILSNCNFPQITKYYGSFVKGFKLWIIMELLDAGSCLDLLIPQPFSEPYIAILCRDLLKALNYLHESGKIHRDLKAANVLVNNFGQVKIADFGVATQLTNNLSRRNTFVGTPFWMPPEVILQQDYNYKADIWSLGITAIEFALGKPPLANLHPMKVLFLIPDNPPPTLPRNKNYSPEFQNFVKLCLHKNPRDRPTAKQLLRHKFIKNAGDNKLLINLINIRKDWESKNRDYNKISKKIYEPTIISDDPNNPISNIAFDFDTIKL
ncbi:STE20 family serine/threonine-protein kinase, partial [Ascoidea rubescens DSM 1968]